MNITKDTVVAIHYTLTNDRDQVLDSSSGKDPLVYMHGSSAIIPGLESALEGRKKGDHFKVTIAPEDAYGTRDLEMIQSVSKKEFENSEQLKVGMRFQINTPEEPLVLTVIEIRDSEIVLDGNHPLAGETLHFDVTVADVRKATEEELDHGHVHGEGGHHHH